MSEKLFGANATADRTWLKRLWTSATPGYFKKNKENN